MLWFLLGIAIGFIIATFFYLFKRTSGILKIDHSNPEKDLYRFEIDDLDGLSKKKRVVLKVDNDANLSQK